jgi:hypothetical protein
MGLLLFSGRLFQTRVLPAFLLAALVLGRLYAGNWDPVEQLQVTPLRLDLWFPLLVVVYWLGPYHWLTGLVCGLLMLCIKNFGIIYSLAYLQLLVTLWAISYFNSEKRLPFASSLGEFGMRCAVPVTIMVCFGIFSHFLFRNTTYGDYAGNHLQIGIGFIRIAADSFYWYVPVMMSVVIVLLIRLRNSVSTAYLASGFLLTYFAIGNSVYFFGWSHEQNIINISIVLLFLFFFMLDLISRFLDERAGGDSTFLFLRRNGSVVMASAMIAAIAIFYSHNIVLKTATQMINIKSSQAIYPLPVNFYSLNNYINGVRAVTSYSSKVYFIDGADFELYYYGGYAPVGYCNPFQTWTFTRDLNRFLQGLLDSGYYLVCSDEMKYLLANLQYNTVNELGQNVVVAKLTDQTPKP